MIPRVCQVVTICIAVLSAANARADSCRNSLPIDDRQLSPEEVRTCLEPRAKALVALHLLGENEIKWSDYGTIRRKCVGDDGRTLSEDPIVWAVEVSSCPQPKWNCGCPAMAGSSIGPENAEAPPMRDANLQLIKREGVLATQRAKRECREIEAALRAVPKAIIRNSCRSLR